MKLFNLKSLSILLSFLFFSAAIITAQPNQRKNPRKKTARFINKTNLILAATGKQVKAKKVYTGYLNKAKSLEKKAIGHFNKKEHKKAVKKSYIARRYAFMAYKANGGTIPEKWRLSDRGKVEIKKLFEKKVTDEELKAKVTNEEKKADETEDGVVEDVEEGGDS